MKTSTLEVKLFILGVLLFSNKCLCFSQNDVMMQAFYWNLPVDTTHRNSTWWDELRNKLPELKTSGITALWLPSPCKGNWGIGDMGYGIYDLYDLGNYNQKNTTETRFGSRLELSNLIFACHQSPKIEVYADAVLNHNYGEWGQNEESNPAVKAYVLGEAHGGTNTAYQNDDIKWIIPNATPGDYYIQIKGYNLNAPSFTDRGYNVNINWKHMPEIDPNIWESEPNNGNGKNNIYPGSGITLRCHSDYTGDIDEFKITITEIDTIVIKLQAMKEVLFPAWNWKYNDQTNGYYPIAVWHDNTNIIGSLEAMTKTKSSYPMHTGAGEDNFQWGYADFHPSDTYDWLGNGGFQDEIVPNTRWFGNDYNTYSSIVQTRLNNWGKWMINTVGFDGFRLDFVRGYQVEFISNWIKNLPKNGSQQRYIVGEYWTTDYPYRLKDWVNNNAINGASVNIFDFPLKFTLTSMCNNNGSTFDMKILNHAGMIRNNTGSNIPGTSVSTFLGNHDTEKEHDKWIRKDWKMGYAYILTHEGRPCVFYSHFYAIKQIDNDDSTIWTMAPASLKSDIKKLTFIRKTYLGGVITVLTEVGNPEPSADTYNLYVARREGNGTKNGAIIVLNNHNSIDKNIWVDSSPMGLTNWAGKWLKNAFNTTERVHVQADGRVNVHAAPRSYAIYVLEDDYIKCKF